MAQWSIIFSSITLFKWRNIVQKSMLCLPACHGDYVGFMVLWWWHIVTAVIYEVQPCMHFHTHVSVQPAFTAIGLLATTVVCYVFPASAAIFPINWKRMNQLKETISLSFVNNTVRHWCRYLLRLGSSSDCLLAVCVIILQFGTECINRSVF